MTNEPLLEVIDDLAPVELFAEACKLSAAKGWYFGHGSHDGDWGRFWKMDLEGVPVFDAIWNLSRERCEQLTGTPLRVLRQYANGHTYGLGGQPHADDQRPGFYTLLYYPMQEWKDGWEGETVFFDERGEVVNSVRPVPNRGILFDSRIPHAGRAPGRICPALRVSVAYKLESATEPGEREEPPIAQPVKRHYTVRVAEERIRGLIGEHLAKLGQTLRIPGFRPGKIPAAVLEQRYGAGARAEVLKDLAEEAASSVPKGSLVTAIEIASEPQVLVFGMSAVHLPDLPEPDFSQVQFERLIASPCNLEAAGVTMDDLLGHLKQQVLDHLERSYDFALPGSTVERELAAIRSAAESRGALDVNDDVNDTELRRMAERRVRLGILVVELARRRAISGARMEEAVIESLLSQAHIRERTVSVEELRQLL